MTEDRDRLYYLYHNAGIEGFDNLEDDCYDYAQVVAEENGRDEPTAADEFNGWLRMIDAARKEEGK